MKPIVFGGRFGWLHAGTGARGVVLCSPYGHEDTWSRKALRTLADELCALGFTVLRFDYIGTGDSADAEETNNIIDAAVDDVCAAVARLKEDPRITDVTLCGFRLGASFAAFAACRSFVNALILLAPIVDGRRYIRELTLLRKTWLDQLPAPIRGAQLDGGGLDVLGQIYRAEFIAQLRALDIADAFVSSRVPLADRSLILDVTSGASEKLYKTLRRLGSDTECGIFEGYSAFMQETAFSVMPREALATIVNWASTDTLRRSPSARIPTAAAWNAAPSIQTAHSIERPVSYGPPGLFAILCEPRGMDRHSSVLLIANTSANAHVGDSRLSVRIARALARQGFASLRIDARGFGDSAPLPPGQLPSNPSDAIHSDGIIEDVARAAAWLEAQGYTDVVSFGICSGAYATLRAALVEPAIAGVIAVNLQRFYVPKGMALSSGEQQVNSMAGYASSLFDWSRWRKVFRGERSLTPVARAILGHAAARTRSILDNTLGSRSDPSANDPRGVVLALRRKGVDTLLVYGAFDSGLDQLHAQFGKHGRRLPNGSKVKVEVLAEIDHALFSPHAAATVIARCEAFMQSRNADAFPVREAWSRGDRSDAAPLSKPVDLSEVKSAQCPIPR